MRILLNILTHGDERIGLKVAKEVQKFSLHDGELLVHIANKKAFEAGKRFIDQDLNRSFPGKKNGNYEERLAYRISPLVKSADIVIDIHSTKTELRDAIIVTRLTAATKACLEAIRPKYVLVMKATEHNALISQAKIGLAFEYGKDNDRTVLKKIVADSKKLLSHLGVMESAVLKKRAATKYFEVISEISKPKGYMLLKKIKNYKLVKKGEVFAAHTATGKRLVAEEDFYPILFGNKNYHHIFGFKGKKLS